MLNRIAKIRSHAGIARFYAECDEGDPIAYLARVQVEEIRSPYAYSPSKPIYRHAGRKVVVFETSHKVYEVYEVPANMLTFATDDAATEWNTRFSRPSKIA